MDQRNQKSGYGKRPLWQWALIYVIVGGAVYGVIYAVAYKPVHGNAYGAKVAPQASQSQAAPASNAMPATNASNTPAPTPMNSGGSYKW